MFHRSRSALVAVLLAMTLVVPTAGAQESQEVGERPPDNEIPGAEQCTIEPRTVDELNSLIPEATPEPDELPPYEVEELPTGEDASEDEIATITEAVTMGIACLNAGDELAYYATFSVAWLSETFAGAEPMPEDAEATPVVEDQEQWLLGITDAIVLPNGNLGAAVTIGGVDDDHPAPGQTFFMVMLQEDGMWRISQQIERVDGEYVADLVTPVEEATPEATPAS